MSTRLSLTIVLLLILGAFVAGVIIYPQLPERVASHWNAQGQVDGYMPRFWGVFLLPLMMLFLLGLFLLIPVIDPLKSNIATFRGYFNNFIVMITSYLLYIHLMTVAWNLGWRFNFIQPLAPAFAALIYYCGVLMERARRNWFIGIRTPWTLSSDTVWAKTHRIGGRLFKLSGLLALLGVILPDWAILFVLVPLLVASVYTVVYSYFAYQQEINLK